MLVDMNMSDITVMLHALYFILTQIIQFVGIHQHIFCDMYVYIIKYITSLNRCNPNGTYGFSPM